MSYSRFVQLCAAFHPESGTAKEGEKCHQLRNTIKQLNKAAKLGMFFNNGGTASKSNYNAVRQYNNSKPDECRIDFFILANASDGHNFIYHIDIYWGKNVQKYFY